MIDLYRPGRSYADAVFEDADALIGSDIFPEDDDLGYFAAKVGRVSVESLGERPEVIEDKANQESKEL